MNVTILRPTGAGDTTGLSKYPNTTSNYLKVDEETADDDATYVFLDAGGVNHDLYTYPASGLPSNAVIHYVRLYHRSKGSDATNTFAKSVLKTHSTSYYGTNRYPTTYTEYYDEWTTNPNTGSAWTTAEVDVIQAGPYEFCYSGSYYSRTTQFWISIGWDYPCAAGPQLIGLTRW